MGPHEGIEDPDADIHGLRSCFFDFRVEGPYSAWRKACATWYIVGPRKCGAWRILQGFLLPQCSALRPPYPNPPSLTPRGILLAVGTKNPAWP